VGLEFSKEVRLPNGLPPPTNIIGKRENSKDIFDNYL
jgi:hypothetical protein